APIRPVELRVVAALADEFASGIAEPDGVDTDQELVGTGVGDVDVLGCTVATHGLHPDAVGVPPQVLVGQTRRWAAVGLIGLVGRAPPGVLLCERRPSPLLAADHASIGQNRQLTI